jgi:hypothetical protein
LRCSARSGTASMTRSGSGSLMPHVSWFKTCPEGGVGGYSPEPADRLIVGSTDH